jgi:glyceraldehyde 3-phosphate dehydrogenase
VPIPIGSIADMTFVTSRRTAIDEANWILTEESETRRYAGIVGVSRDPLVLKIMSWYDNEWGYANQMIRQAMSLIAAERRPAA